MPDVDSEDTSKPSGVGIILSIVFIAAVIGEVFVTSPAPVLVENNTSVAEEMNTTNITEDYGTVSKNTFINEQGELIMPWQNSTPENKTFSSIEGK